MKVLDAFRWHRNAGNSKEERDAELRKDQAETTIRITKSFDLLIELQRKAKRINELSEQLKADPSAGAYSSASERRTDLMNTMFQDLIQPLLRADPDLMDHDFNWLMVMLKDRFDYSLKHLEQFEHLDDIRPDATCPYTAAEHDAAVKKAGTKKTAIAAELGIDPKTLRKWERNNEKLS